MVANGPCIRNLGRLASTRSKRPSPSLSARMNISSAFSRSGKCSPSSSSGKNDRPYVVVRSLSGSAIHFFARSAFWSALSGLLEVEAPQPMAQTRIFCGALSDSADGVEKCATKARACCVTVDGARSDRRSRAAHAHTCEERGRACSSFHSCIACLLLLQNLSLGQDTRANVFSCNVRKRKRYFGFPFS